MSEKKLIIIGTDDKIKIAPYEGYSSITAGVGGGLMELFHTDKIPCPLGNIPIDFYCNEEFLYREEDNFKKCNALATAIYSGGSTPIYGDVVIVKRVADDVAGLDFVRTPEGEEDLCECWFVEDILMRYANQITKELGEIHSVYDDNRPEPSFEFYSLDDVDDILDTP